MSGRVVGRYICFEIWIWWFAVVVGTDVTSFIHFVFVICHLVSCLMVKLISGNLHMLQAGLTTQY